MPYFYTPSEFISGQNLKITGQEARHIITVLRHQIGDYIEVIDNTGYRYLARLAKIEKDNLVAEICQKEKLNNEPSLNLHLYLALLKGKKFDFVIQKATELGVTSIYPLVTSRTIKKINSDKIRHWQEIAKMAVCQSKRSFIPQVYPMQDFSDALDNLLVYDLNLILWEQERQITFKQISRDFSAKKSISLWIGPEGGFSKEEITMSQEKGLICVSLGNIIFKSETSVVVALTLVQYIFGNLCGQ